ncbi:MAG: hypothetical protein ACLRWQ_20375 [Flavonifractor plautii]
MPEKTTYYDSAYFDGIYHPRTAWEHIRGIEPYVGSPTRPLGKPSHGRRHPPVRHDPLRLAVHKGTPVRRGVLPAVSCSSEPVRPHLIHPYLQRRAAGPPTSCT